MFRSFAAHGPSPYVFAFFGDVGDVGLGADTLLNIKQCALNRMGTGSFHLGHTLGLDVIRALWFQSDTLCGICLVPCRGRRVFHGGRSL